MCVLSCWHSQALASFSADKFLLMHQYAAWQQQALQAGAWPEALQECSLIQLLCAPVVHKHALLH